MNQLLPKRIVIYPKDVENITGRKEKTARKLFNDIKANLGKGKSDFLFVNEFSQALGLKEEEVSKFLV